MGTNFYAIDPSVNNFASYLPREVEKTLVHIGKRSGAGWYCYACGISLCKEGNGALHLGKSLYKALYHMDLKILADGDPFFKACPKCGQKRPEYGEDAKPSVGPGNEKTAVESPAGGVRSVCTFGWAILPYDLWQLLSKYDDDEYCIVNEYGDKFTKKEFREVEYGKYCPIDCFSLVGEEFS